MSQSPSNDVHAAEGGGTRRLGRPRSEPARQAVLEAAYALLEEGGLDNFSIDAVSRRTGVARTTIYRRWSSRSVLAVDSFLEHFRPQLDATPSGDPVNDFRALVGSLAAALAGPAGRVAASVVAYAQRDSETQRLFREEFSGPLRRESTKVLDAGVTAGRFRTDLDVPRVIDAFVGAIYFRLLLGSSLDRRWAEALCDTLLAGCLPGADYCGDAAGSASRGTRPVRSSRDTNM